MKRIGLGLAVLVALGVAGYSIKRSASSTPVVDPLEVPVPSSSPAPAPATARDGSLTLRGTTSADAASAVATPLLDGDAAHTLLRDAASSADAAQLTTIALYLRHSDADIRDAAREAIVQLGEPAGVLILRSAADQATDPADARALRNSADFLALPSWSQRSRDASIAPDAGSPPGPEAGAASTR